ncbi:MAG: sigma-54 dependent transcriptional regulator [Gammaproteobacteria bacterium]
MTHQQAQLQATEEANVFRKLIGQSVPMQQIKQLIRQVASCDSNVLIIGQSGTGKDIIASCIHDLSNRRYNPLVPINCGAIPTELMESELFGHEKGAFTGAATKRPGRFEIANTGTLFLDEIGDMPLPMQVKLLRVIQERKVDRVGSHTSIDIDVRIISATNQSLEDLIQQNRFREDLYYRLNVFPIYVPSLAERPDDIPALIDYHLDIIAERLNRRVAFTDNALSLLSEYNWPGNIRELANFIERMVILYDGKLLNDSDLDGAYKKKASHVTKNMPAQVNLATEVPFNIKEYIANIEQQLIQAALQKSNGVISSAAEYLSLGRTTLIEKMRKYNLVWQGIN